MIGDQGVQILFFEHVPIFSYFSYFLAGEAKICIKIEHGIFSCMYFKVRIIIKQVICRL